MDLTSDVLQAQYDLIHSYFKTTTEPYDFLEWDGRTLKVWFEDCVVENYEYADLGTFIPDWGQWESLSN